MTPRTWAEAKVAKAVTGYQWNGRIRKSTVTLPAIAAKLLLAEHQRAVRIIKAEIKRVKLDQHSLDAHTKGHVLDALENVLAALERGRK